MKVVNKILIINFLFISCYTLNNHSNNYLIAFLNDYQNLFIDIEITSHNSSNKEQYKELMTKVINENDMVVKKWSSIKDKIKNADLTFLKHFDEYATVYLKYIKLKNEYDEQQAYAWGVISGKIDVSPEEFDNARKIYHDAEIYYKPVYVAQNEFDKYAELITNDWKAIIEKQPPGNLEIVEGVKRIIDLSLILKFEKG